MTAARWQQVREILYAASQMEEARRASYIQEQCGSDGTLRIEVEELLGALEESRSFLESPLGKVPDLEDVQIGPYRILDEAGRGGMGIVYRALRDDEYRQIVAVKLVRAELATKALTDRFRIERQTLALLNHPNIARLLDGGTTADGRPYLVMEWIEGRPIDQYCREGGLTARQRLELFVHICDAVSHAHRNLVVHRDLKPSNILITAEGQPKLLDFGIAKVFSGEESAPQATLTLAGAQPLTPEYASPEQVRQEPVTTATDVYSLGAVLYELLTGVKAHHIEARTPAGIERAICDEPTPPASSVATAGGIPRRQLRGDLDNILARALEKEPARRYRNVDEFAADIRRHLGSEPVLARPTSLLYKASRFGRRYRLALVTAAAFLAVIILAAAVSIRQSIRANREAASAQAVNDFLQDDLLAQASAAAQSGARFKPDPDLKVRTALDRAAARVTGKFDHQPEVEAAIRDTMGQTYLDLGLYPDARKQLEQALALRRRVLGAENPKTLKTASRLGFVAFLQGRYSEAEALLRRTLEAQRRVLGPQHPDTLYATTHLADIYRSQGNYPQAEVLTAQTLEIQRRVLGPEHPVTLASMGSLAIVYSLQGKYSQAEALGRQTVEIKRRVLGPEHPSTLNSMSNLASAYYSQAKYGESEALNNQVLEIRRRVLGPEHPATLGTMNNLAADYLAQGKNAQSEALDNQVLVIRQRILGAEHPETLASMNNLAIDYQAGGKYAQAERLESQALETKRRLLGPEHPDAIESAYNLARIETYQGKYAAAESLFGQTLEISRRVLGPEHPLTLSLLADFAALYQREGKYTMAESDAEAALAGRRHSLGPEHADTIAATADLALAYLSEGKFVESEPLARQALEISRRKQPGNWQRFRAESLMGASLAGEKKYVEAEPLLLEGYQGMAARKALIAMPDRYHLDRSHDWIVQLYQEWGKPEQAAEWKKK